MSKKPKKIEPITADDIIKYLMANEKKTAHLAKMVLIGVETYFIVDNDGKVINWYGEKHERTQK